MLDLQPVVLCDSALRQGRPSVDDLTMHLRLLYLLPYTVHVDHQVERAAHERRAAQERASRLLARIPSQRPSNDPRRTPTGAPARPNTTWGTRSARR